MSLREKNGRVFVVGLCLVALCGCGKEINGRYGMRRGGGGDSVNGTAVLAGMFEQAGFKVSSWRRLSPRLEQAQVLVWAPDDFDTPSLRERDYLEDWVGNGAGRTVIYIGRDFDALPEYWRKIQPHAPPDQADEVARRLAKARTHFDQQRAVLPKEEYARWFKLTTGKSLRRVTTLSGEWAKGIDAKSTEIDLRARFEIPVDADIPTKPPPKKKTKGGIRAKSQPATGPAVPTNEEELVEPTYLPDHHPLLTSEGDVIVDRVREDHWNNGQIIVVTNGSFLTNLPLVNVEHRKLAAKLIEACGPPGQAVFLESGAGGLEIHNSEATPQPPTGIALFLVWPLNVVLFHLLALGILYCCARFPIFGRPHTLPKESVSDFGTHITALGELMEQTKDAAIARDRLAYYHAHVKRDSGVSHGKPRT